MKRILVLLALIFTASGAVRGQGFDYRSKYPDIPIVDVHTHAVKMSDLADYDRISDAIERKYGSNLAFRISLETPPEPLEKVRAANPRVIYAVTDMRPVFGPAFTADQVIAKVRDEGYVGLMFWFGNPYKFGNRIADRIDDPVYEPLFTALERAGVPLTSGQIADPNGPFGDRQEWIPDPVQYWTQIRGFENMLAAHPDLTVIGAYCAWMICQDGQIDFLRYLFSTYPNFYVDLGAVCQYFHLVDRDNLRDLFIEYQDRILFGSDGGRYSGDIESYADRYARFFALLETDKTVNGGYWGDRSTRGLDLPREVLEKIYYRNALKLYPGLGEAMGLGR